MENEKTIVLIGKYVEKADGKSSKFNCAMACTTQLLSMACTAHCPIGHFTIVYSVTRPMNGSEAAGDVLIQTSLFLSCKSCCCDAN